MDTVAGTNSRNRRADLEALEVFKTCYGPLLEIFAALEHAAAAALERDLIALVDQFNRSGDDSMVAPGEYLEIIIALQ